MPKYYIRDGAECCIIDAPTPVMGCVFALDTNKFSSAMVNGWYWVSERGFNAHADDLDVKVDSNEVNEIFAAMIDARKNPEKPDEWG